MTIHSFNGANARRIVLNIVSCHQPMTLTDIAHAASHHFGRALSREEIEQAIDGLRERGHRIESYNDGIAVEYWIEQPTGGDAA